MTVVKRALGYMDAVKCGRMDALLTSAKPILAAGLPGMFIAFEGPDGSGKSTQFRRFAALAREAGVLVCEVREPGGTPIGEQVRQVLLDRQNEVMCVRCEMLLYMASRAQLVEQTIRPALAAGQLVLADRFVASTLVYQGAAGGMGQEEIAAVAAVATGGLEPDLNVVFDVDTQTAMGRLSPLLDRMEAKGRAFHEKVRAGYQGLVRSRPDRYVSIDASRHQDEVWKSCVETMMARITRK